MNLLKLILISSLVYAYHHVDCCLDNSVNNLMEHLKTDESINRVNLIVRPMDQLSSASSTIIQRVTVEFPTTITYMGDEKSSEDKCLTSTEVAKMTAKRSELRIGIIESQNHLDSNGEMLSMLEFIGQQNPLVRGKCMIILIGGDNSTYKTFLEFGWGINFLDLSVVELLLKDEGNEIHRHPAPEECSNIIYLHNFNPFHDSYDKTILSANSTIFKDKVRNLNGFPIHVMGSQLIPLELMGLFILHRQFANILNFKMILHSLENWTPKLIRFSKTRSSATPNISIKSAREQRTVDYSISFADLNVPVNDSRAVCFKPSNFLLEIEASRYENYFVAVRQYNSPIVEVPASFLMTLGIFFVIVMIFSVFSRIFKFNGTNWTIKKISSILLGASSEYRGPSRLSELMLRICLFSVSGLITIYLNDDMMNILLGHQRLLPIKNFKDLSKSNLQIKMSIHTKKKLARSLPFDTDVMSILNRSQVYDDDEIIKRSLTKTLHKSKQAHLFFVYQYNGGTSGSSLSEVRSSHLPEGETINDESGGSVVVIDKPVTKFGLIAKMKHTSFFLNQFHKYTMKIKESGLDPYWANFLLGPKPKGDGSQYQMANCYDCDTLDHDNMSSEIPLHTRLVSFLIVGYSMAGVILICEIMWKRFGDDLRITYPLLWKILFGALNSNYPEDISNDPSFPRDLLSRGNNHGYQSHLQQK
ncbi:hypothetical protein QAD02_004534 [Eretmocerus hayati]|uniref:Uncharacterized protein n=1 Tax=Eretmocerus hayati TaxID=131215 RepID=A0ACC2NSQ5_9HYME|nr:hypothetical protein QAD02_004534 [Eretmocerus hayati]